MELKFYPQSQREDIVLVTSQDRGPLGQPCGMVMIRVISGSGDDESSNSLAQT